jgi:ATP-binding cassette subfamily F protein 3
MIDLSQITLQFNGRYLFRDINFKVNSGEKICLVGANGSGKSSLLKIINGDLKPESGKIRKQKRISIGYLPQENIIHSGKTLLEEAKSALTNVVALHGKEKEIISSLTAEKLSAEEQNDLVNQLGEIHHELEASDFYTIDVKIKKILAGLGFEESDFDKYTKQFSGGWQMRIALAKILISQNDLIMLDEPTNHLDLDSLRWLINFLKSYTGALLIVSHDKYFVNQVTDKTLEIFMGKFNVFKGKYDAYLKYKEERDTQLAELHERQQKKIKETEKFIEKFRYKATKAKQVQSRIKQLEKLELVEIPDEKSNIKIKFPSPPQSGKLNIQLAAVSKSFGEKKLFQNLDFDIYRGDKIAFVGPNGAGKTTLAKIIASEIKADSGKRNIGHNTFISYYAQDVADALDPERTILETVEKISEDKTQSELRSLLGCFLFSGDDVFKKVSVLSGGEKSRVALGRILLTKSNLIILDEPTNHLDISSKEVLQSALINFPGSLVLVSHDIDFLRPIINKVVDIRKGSLKVFSGDIDYYLSKREESLTEEESIKKNSKNDGTASRKEQKKAEAEMRQEKYNATKNLSNQTKHLEKEISRLEMKEKEIQDALSKPATYQDSNWVKEKTIELNNLKAELESKLQKWERLSIELQKIEQKFNQE